VSIWSDFLEFTADSLMRERLAPYFTGLHTTFTFPERGWLCLFPTPLLLFRPLCYYCWKKPILASPMEKTRKKRTPNVDAFAAAFRYYQAKIEILPKERRSETGRKACIHLFFLKSRLVGKI
jgi:hypothetical protein